MPRKRLIQEISDSIIVNTYSAEGPTEHYGQRKTCRLLKLMSAFIYESHFKSMVLKIIIRLS